MLEYRRERACSCSLFDSYWDVTEQWSAEPITANSPCVQRDKTKILSFTGTLASSFRIKT
jgi:hypothetical protein